MMEMKPICQSCGMPLDNDNMKGTEKDGSLSDDYCLYCYANGSFTYEMTMEEMVQTNIQHLDEWKKNSGMEMTEEEAAKQLRLFLPMLKRWKD